MKVVINIMSESQTKVYDEARNIIALGYKITDESFLDLEKYGETNKYVITLKK